MKTTISKAIQLLASYVERDIPTMLWGPPGIGKSEGTAQVAESLGVSFIDVRLPLLSAVDLRGLPHVEKSDVGEAIAKWARPAFLPDATENGERGILLLDEINAAPMLTQVAAYQLVHQRQVGEHELEPGWICVGAGNRRTDRAGAQAMPSALANRMAHIEVEADVEAWVNWATAQEIHPAIVGFIRWRPNLLLDMEHSDLRAFPTPRSWTTVDRVMDAEPELLHELVGGIVGEGPAAEFAGFLDTYRSLPPLSDILADPESAPVPEEPSALFAVSTGIARQANTDNVDRVFTYSSRLPREFDVLVGVDIAKRDSNLTETRAFAQWAQRNSEVTT